MAFQSDFCAYIATHSETAKGVIFFIMCAFGRTPTLYHCPPKQGKKGRNVYNCSVTFLLPFLVLLGRRIFSLSDCM